MINCKKKIMYTQITILLILFVSVPVFANSEIKQNPFELIEEQIKKLEEIRVKYQKIFDQSYNQSSVILTHFDQKLRVKINDIDEEYNKLLVKRKNKESDIQSKLSNEKSKIESAEKELKGQEEISIQIIRSLNEKHKREQSDYIAIKDHFSHHKNELEILLQNLNQELENYVRERDKKIGEIEFTFNQQLRILKEKVSDHPLKSVFQSNKRKMKKLNKQHIQVINQFSIETYNYISNLNQSISRTNDDLLELQSSEKNFYELNISDLITSDQHKEFDERLKEQSNLIMEAQEKIQKYRENFINRRIALEKKLKEIDFELTKLRNDLQIEEENRREKITQKMEDLIRENIKQIENERREKQKPSHDKIQSTLTDIFQNPQIFAQMINKMNSTSQHGCVLSLNEQMVDLKLVPDDEFPYVIKTYGKTNYGMIDIYPPYFNSIPFALARIVDQETGLQMSSVIPFGLASNFNELFERSELVPEKEVFYVNNKEKELEFQKLLISNKPNLLSSSNEIHIKVKGNSNNGYETIPNFSEVLDLIKNGDGLSSIKVQISFKGQKKEFMFTPDRTDLPQIITILGIGDEDLISYKTPNKIRKALELIPLLKGFRSTEAKIYAFKKFKEMIKSIEN